MSLNPAAPAPGALLCRLDELPDPGARGFRFEAGEAAFRGFVLRRGEAVTGFIDSCPHTDGPLSPGGERYLTRDGKLLLCFQHGALFTLDGQCIAGPCVGRALRPWPVEVRDGAVVAG